MRLLNMLGSRGRWRIFGKCSAAILTSALRKGSNLEKLLKKLSFIKGKPMIRTPGRAKVVESKERKPRESFVSDFRRIRPLLTSRSGFHRRPFRHEARSPRLRTRSFLPAGLHRCWAHNKKADHAGRLFHAAGAASVLVGASGFEPMTPTM